MYRILLVLSFFTFLRLGPVQAPKKLLLFYAKNRAEPSLFAERIQALERLARENNFVLDTARIGSKFSESNLQKYEALIFLNPAPELLDNRQRGELERYIQAGGGLLQISMPPATEPHWPWYTRLQEAGLKAQYVKNFQVEDKSQLKYWRTTFDGGFYSQITLSSDKQSFQDSDWFQNLPDELTFLTYH